MADKLTFKKPVEFEAGATIDFGNNTVNNLILPLTTTISSDKVTGLADELAKKVDVVEGKQLSTNDYDDTARAKVDNIPEDPKYTDTITVVAVTQEQTAGTKIAAITVDGLATDLYVPKSDIITKSDTNGNIKINDNETVVYDDSAVVATAETAATKANTALENITAIDSRVTALEDVGATKVEVSSTNGNIKINNNETTVYTLPDAIKAITVDSANGVSDGVNTYKYDDSELVAKADGAKTAADGAATSVASLTNNVNSIDTRVKTLEDVGATKVEASNTNGNIVINGKETSVYVQKQSTACHTEFLPTCQPQMPLKDHCIKKIGGSGGGIYEAYFTSSLADMTVQEFLGSDLNCSTFYFDLYNYWWAVNSGKYGFTSNYLARQTRAAGHITLENKKYTGKDLIHLRKHYVSKITSQPTWKDLLVFLLGEYFVDNMIDKSSTSAIKVRILRGYSDVMTTTDTDPHTTTTVEHAHTPRRLAEKVMIGIPTISGAYTDEVIKELRAALGDVATSEKDRTAHSHSRHLGNNIISDQKHLNLDCKAMIVRDVSAYTNQYIPTDVVAYYNITHIYYDAGQDLLCLTFSSDLTENSINHNTPKNNNKNY